MKAGVNKKFMPGVTISSSHANGTIIDNNVACVQQWEGSPVITNTHGLDKRIVLQHANSSVDGFYWIYNAKWTGVDAGVNPTVKILDNTLGGVPVVARDSLGKYSVALAGAFNTKTRTHQTISRDWDNPAEARLEVYNINAGVITFIMFAGSDSEVVDDLSAETDYAFISIIVKP